MKKSAVVGAGIVGLATALTLQKSGRQVTLFDRYPPGEGTSSGNAGIISTGSLFPEATPGIWKDIPGMLLGKLAPVHIKPGYFPKLAPWLFKFLANSSKANFAASTAALSSLSRSALAHYEPLLADAKADDLLRHRGMYYVYESEKNLALYRSLRESTKHSFQAYFNEDNSVEEYSLLSREQLQQAQPALSDHLAGAIFIPGAAFTVCPLTLSRRLFARFQERGGRFIQDEVTTFKTNNGLLQRVSGKENLEVDELFITTGAYSRDFAAELAVPVPLESERGYHLMLPQPMVQLQDSFLFTESGVGMTPMEKGLRLAGTVEFAGLYAAPNYQRAFNLGRIARKLVPGLNTENGSTWMGHRPCLPDSVPVISKSPKYDNVYFGFGHGHLGLTHSAVTAALLLALADNKPTPVDPKPFRIDRRW